MAEWKAATAVVGADGTLLWFSEFVEPQRVEQILRMILPEQDEN
ncbi:hypothetical protein BH23ACT11_BH23ACT11_17270 [soil metagenome]